MTLVILLIIFLTIFFCHTVWQLYAKKDEEIVKNENGFFFIAVIIAIGLTIRILCAVFYYGHVSDMGLFTYWSDTIFRHGISNFYFSDVLHDYPPGYVYVMWVLGAIKNILNLSGGALCLLIKFPAIIADMATSFLIYRIISKKKNGLVSIIFVALFLLNPAVITNSSLWGQVDSILSLFCLLSIYFAAEKKLAPSFFMFAIAVLIKPQAIFFTPVLIYSLIDQVWLCGGFDAKKLGKYVLWALAAITMMLVLFMPFGKTPIEGIAIVIQQYIDTIGSYPYASVNAFNIYTALGKNLKPLTGTIATIGYSSIAVVVVYSAYVFFKSKSNAKHYVTAFILNFGVFMFAPKMHERYAFPCIFMLMFALIATPNTQNFIMYELISLSQFFNTAWILFVYEKDPQKYSNSQTAIAASFVNIIAIVVFIYIIQKYHVRNTVAAKSYPEKKKTPAKHIGNLIKTNKINFESKKINYIIIAIICVIYTAIAFTNLGNRFAPETETVLNAAKVTVDFGDEKEISKLYFYLGPRELTYERNISFEFLDNESKKTSQQNLTEGSVFCWSVKNVNTKARYVVISTYTRDKEPLSLREVCFTDTDGKQIIPTNIDDKRIAALFDEQHMMPQNNDFMCNTYFDEIYHGRTAYEFIHQMTIYEWTHPPLGKLFISIGIMIFGMNPFGWRVVGTLVGILMIPVIYLFAIKLLKKNFLAVIATLLFTFDFMHFAQTRIATIDVYVTFFIILMYYFMYRYYEMNVSDFSLKNTFVTLGLSGFFFGCAVASKWTGLYAGAGLAVIFFYSIRQRYIEYKASTKNKKAPQIPFAKNLFITLGFCVLAFIIVPIAIYALSYIPYLRAQNGHGLVATIIENAKAMYTYHSKTVLGSTHPFSSYWYEWPIMHRPVWYFAHTMQNNLKQGISAFGNPAVWWTGIAATSYIAALAIVIPLKNKKYFGMNKYAYIVIYALFFAVLCVMAFFVGKSNEQFKRMFSYVFAYSAIMVGGLALVILYDSEIKQTSNKIEVFLLIGYFAELIPWMFVLRITYIYHYFPSVPFVVLMIARALQTIYENAKEQDRGKVMIASFAYAAIAIILFTMFYPVLSGHPCNYDYAQNFLKWFKSWVLL